jgi:fatty-acyl-CoA synthase
MLFPASRSGSPVPDFVSLHARGRPGKVALTEAATGLTLTYAALHDRVDRAVSVLKDGYGLDEGDRLAALAKNCSDMVVLHLACARMGAIFTPLNWRLSTTELGAIVEDCDPALVIGDASLDALGPTVARTAPMSDISVAIDAAAPHPSLPTDADAPSLMLYTSGTSGRPKGVLLSERNLLATAINFTIIGEVGADSVFLADSPMFHIIGMVTNFRPGFMMGASTIISDGFVPATTLERMADPDLKVSHYFCVPQMAEMLRADPAFDPKRLPCLKALFTGGAPHPASRIREWIRDGILTGDVSGLTGAATVRGRPLAASVIDGKAGSAGLLPPTMQARLLRPGGEDAGPGEVGELLLKGPNLFTGYWRRPEETRKAFTDGWFHTGDLAMRDADGFYTLVDRKKDMFISGGENIYPAEIEAALAAHPHVAEVAVVGMPDERWGEVGHAAIVLRAGSGADADALLAHCETLLARYKLPKRFHVLDALPRTGSGKVVKARLKTLLAERSV